jgi:hypothetical protein
MTFPPQYFDNGEIRKYVVLFGQMFSNIRLERTDGVTNDMQYQVVPIAYGGREKYIARDTQDPDVVRPVSMQLPRMAYEMKGIAYDPSRQLNPIQRNLTSNTAGITSRFVPTPYLFRFNLYITGRNVQDCSKIVQQIVPYFTPSFNIKADLIADNCAYDLNFTLNDVDMEDNYEGGFMQNRTLVWTLSFTMRGWFFGYASLPGGIIRWVSERIGLENADGSWSTNNIVFTSNTYPVEANTALSAILPTDVFKIHTVKTDKEP